MDYIQGKVSITFVVIYVRDKYITTGGVLLIPAQGMLTDAHCDCVHVTSLCMQSCRVLFAYVRYV